MKRTRSKQGPTKKPVKQARTLFIWNSKRDDSDNEETVVTKGGPQLELILKEGRHFRDSLPLPCEVLLKIFEIVVDTSNDPLVDLFNLSRVSDTWRHMILQTPKLWKRIDFSQLPITDRNLKVIASIFQKNERIIDYVEEVSFAGSIRCKDAKTSAFIETLLTAPKLNTLSINALKQHDRVSMSSIIMKSIDNCKNLRSLSITESRLLFNNQKWICDHLVKNGQQLEVLNLAMSLSTISTQLFKAIDSNFCPNIRVLDISTCDALETHSFDAIQLTQNMPNLEVLRVGNVSFKKVHDIPKKLGLTKLKELSMPKSMRDLKRDDRLVITLTYGSNSVNTLDLRGAAIAPFVLYDMPSSDVKELHIDDIYPLQRNLYFHFINKWAQSLKVLSLVKINCTETVRQCLEALILEDNSSNLRELDLSTSDVAPEDLIKYIKRAHKLESINLTSCRSLPRGSKCFFKKNTNDNCTKKWSLLEEALNMTPTPLNRVRKSRLRQY